MIVIDLKSVNLREKLLKQKNLDLATCIDICRADEEANKQSRNIKENIGYINEIRKTENKGINVSEKKYNYNNTENTNKRLCQRCGFTHEYEKCPAYGKFCNKCKGKNHFAKMCKRRNVREICYEEENNVENYIKIGLIQMTCNKINKFEEWTEKININGHILTLKVDTGSQANILPYNIFRFLKNVRLEKSDVKLLSYSKHVIPLKGKCDLTCKYKDVIEKLTFFITEEKTESIIGLEGIIKLKIIIEQINKINIEDSEENSVSQIIKKYKDVFKGIGCTNKPYKIRLKNEAIPTIARCRKIPQVLLTKVKSELDRMEKENIVAKVSEPTEWLHPIVVVEKPDGNVRLCMDPRPLNKYIRRERLELPTLETVLASVKDSKFFTVLDATQAFHQIPLDETSSYLCTITTPFGRYRFKRVPYGLCSASEVFQKSINEMLENIQGAIAYTDDVLIHGKTKKEHDRNLEEVLKQARQHNIKFKENKLQTGVDKIKYLGYEISQNGINISKEKIKAIIDMRRPQNKKELQCFLGMVNFLGKFIQNLSEKTKPLRNLLKQDTVWTWEENGPEENCFKQLKKEITEAPTLIFFDPNKEIVITSDACKDGIGGALIQDGQPVAYCSSSLNPAQTKYAIIEKELLAILHACEHFHYYVYGRNFTVHTDHKPLIGLVNKPIDDLSPRLQSLVLRLMKYRAKLEYKPGKVMHLPDCLSRLPTNPKTEIKTDYMQGLRVQCIIVASQKRAEEIKEETKKDTELQQVLYYIINGWPKKFSNVSREAKPYFQYKEDIFEKDGYIFNKKKLIVPINLRRTILNKLHEVHQGINSTLKRAQESLYWPNMVEDIKILIEKCRICQQYGKSMIKEPMHLHLVPDCPWYKISADFMKVNGSQYMLITDYYSKFVSIVQMKSTKAEFVIKGLNSIFATHGLPVEFMSDNGPPFDSRELKMYLQSLSIKCITSSPNYSQSNGLIERHIQTIKNLIKKSPDISPYIIVMVYNSTPKSNIPSPAEILMGRKIRTDLPIMKKLLRPNNQKWQIKNNLQKNQVRQKKYYDRSTKIRKDLTENVWLQKEPHKKWIKGKIIQQTEFPDSYMVKTDDMGTYRRNKIHIKNRNGDDESLLEGCRDVVVCDGTEEGVERERAMEEDILDRLRENTENRDIEQRREDIENKDIEQRPRRNHKMPLKFNDYVL